MAAAAAAAAAAEPPAAHQFPLPKVLQHPASAPPMLITQGAEGRLYKTTYLVPEVACALKYRPTKPWRHPILDQRLTRHRILSEARILAKCRREGVRVPAVYAIDETTGCLMLEWIHGAPVRVRINEVLRNRTGDEVQRHEGLRSLMRRIGAAVGGLHKIGIVHGDLTTSNMMLEEEPAEARDSAGDDNSNNDNLNGEVVVIDLGLASGSVQDEERAVDLYVLERAFGSTHPRAEILLPEMLDAYKQSFKQAPTVLKKLQDVRMRGRKRSMVG